MELLSDLATWGEALLNVWADGAYNCARCKAGLYSSDDKWRGPCPWPSWRREDGNVEALEVLGYNSGPPRYACEVCELYCAKCSLFLGHRFEDAVARGDTHAGARFRH
ncbi:hypothetical protein M885DRAFT_554473 [Pelagophyceae sp. CCMP2097]|nr:hypothetical protein M885DRAFT_554473 [Pelagophyceae sp. CCMP2097]